MSGSWKLLENFLQNNFANKIICYICDMYKAFKYRIYPTKEQAILINKHIGASRFVYNLALETKRTAWAGNRISLSRFDLINQISELRSALPWLEEISSESLQHPITNLDNAYKSFYKGASKFPKYKSKHGSAQSFTVSQCVKIKKDKLIITKFRKGIDIVVHTPLVGSIKRLTISRTNTEKYFASIVCVTGEEMPQKPVIKRESSIGVDLGIKDFAITSEGEVIDNPKYLRKTQSKLKYIQRKYSKHRGVRTKRKLSLIHERVANQRKDFLQKTSTKLIRENQTICLEDLEVSNMIKNHSLAQSISDAGWMMFVAMLQYKAEWYGKNIVRIGRFDPSSKTCSCCGFVNGDLVLSTREWRCISCGSVHDRDVNAAINIKEFALKNTLSGIDRENQGELPALARALILESHTVHTEG